MHRLSKLLISIGLLAMSGCVVAPYPYGPYGYRGYYGPRIGVVIPPPVVVVHPYRW